MAKITHSELIEDNIFQPTIQEALQLVKALEGVQQGFKGIAKEANTKLQNNPLGSAEEIAAFNVETQRATIASKEYEKAAKDRITAEERLQQAIEGETDKTLQLRYELNKLNKAKRDEIQASDASLGAYKRASMQLNKLRASYKDLAVENKHNTDVAKKMKIEIDKLDGTLKKVDATVGQHQRNVGNYASAFNPLNNSINQLTREAPAFANSMQTGFMAISNNIPILTDAIGQLRHQNKQLRAEGKPTTSVLSQIAKGFFSWGTALSLGVTLLTVYGAELVDFVGSLFDANKKTKEQIELEKKINEERKESVAQAEQQKKSIKSMIGVLEDEQKSLKEKKAAYRILKDLVPSLTGLTYEQAKAQGVLNSAISKELKLIDLRIEAKALESLAIEKRKAEMQDQKSEMQSLNNELEKLNEREKSALKNSSVIFTLYDKERKREIKERLKFLSLPVDEQLKSIQLQIAALEDENEVIAELGKDLNDKKAEQAKKEVSIYEELEKSKINLIEDEIERKRQLLRLERDLTVAAIREKYKKSSKAEVKELVENTKKRYNREITELGNINIHKLNMENEFQKELTEEVKIGVDARVRLEEIAAKRVTETLNALEQVQKKSVERRINLIDREIEVSRDRADTLRALAAQGQQDAKDSIALEEKQQAELQAKREQILRRQKRNEFLLSGIKTYAAKVEKGDPNPVGSTIRDLTAISAAIRSLPAFYEGAENVANALGKPHIKGKDGYIVRVDGSERVLTGKQNAMIGNMSNEDLADLAYKYRFNKVEPIKVENKIQDTRHWSAMLAELAELRQTVANKPETSFDYDKVADMVIERVKRGNAIETKLRKNTL